MVLINAIYFLGEWESPFDVNLTVQKPFFTSEKASIQVVAKFTSIKCF